MTDAEILSQIVVLIPARLKEGVAIYIKENLSNAVEYNSLMVKASPSLYRPSESEFFMGRIKKNIGKSRWISFHKIYQPLFSIIGVKTEVLKSAPEFVRIPFSELDLFFASPSAKDIIQTIYLDVFRFDAFGCCARYEECSDLKKCIHPDIIYATACQYRSNLEAGKIFYGKNKNI